jgi:hypothetical protein
MRIWPDNPPKTPRAQRAWSLFFGTSAFLALALAAVNRLAGGASAQELIQEFAARLGIATLVVLSVWLALRWLNRDALTPDRKQVVESLVVANRAKATRYCPRCSASLVPNELFCLSCGSLQWREVVGPAVFVLLLGAILSWFLGRNLLA